MSNHTFTLTAADDLPLFCYRWLPSDGEPKAVVQIGHGMGEHAARYQHFAERLNDAGYAVYANDLRGHGKTMRNTPGYMGEDGWNRAIGDASTLSNHIEAEHPNTPLVYFGHSMGAMLVHHCLTREGEGVSAAILSGSPGLNRATTAWLASIIARVQRRRHGANRHSRLLQAMLFGSANKPFDTPGATGFEWLTSDRSQVTKYLNDSKCGFVLTAGSMLDLFNGSREARKPANIGKIPSQLPIYVFSGSADPVHRKMSTLNRLLKAYRKAGLEVEFRLYAGGRHEMLNETNGDAVINDIIAWLDDHLPDTPLEPKDT